MKITRSATFQMTDTIGEYILVEEDSYEYIGPVARACFGGASSQETNLSNQQAQFYNTLQSNYGQQFSQQSAILGQLNSTFGNILAAGPGQYGFTPQENAALRTQADTGTAQAYQNAKQATGEQLAAVGGGNTFLPSGTTAGINANIATQAAQQQANSQLGITEAGYQQGLQNFQNAAGVLGNVANTLDPTGYSGQATSAGGQAFNSASQIQQQNQQGWQTVAGLLGGAGSAFLGGFGQGIGGGQKPGCWIAEAIWGVHDRNTSLVRFWLNLIWARKSKIGAAVMKLYSMFGQQVARNKTAVRILKPLFNIALRKARAWEKEYVRK